MAGDGRLDWGNHAAVASLTLSFLDMCQLHPALAQHYSNEEDRDLILEREAAIELFLASDASLHALKIGVVAEWDKRGLLDHSASLGCFGAAPSPESEARIKEVTSTTPTQFDLRLKQHRHEALVERERAESDLRDQSTLREKRNIDARRKAGLQRDFKDSEVVRGIITFIDTDRRQGEVYVMERSCATQFNLDWVEYGLKQVKLQDEVTCFVTSRKALQGGGRARELATNVRPAIPRQLDDSDIIVFCKQCQTESKDPEKILFRVLTSVEDFQHLCERLSQRPETVGATVHRMSWFECVMSIVQLAAFPYLHEPRFRSIVAQFHQLMPLTPFPTLVLEACKIVSDRGDVQRAIDIGVFVESLRLFFFNSGGVHDIPDQYFDRIVHLLDRTLKGNADAGKTIPVAQEESLRLLCQSIRNGPEARRLFPSIDCFRYAPSSESHPMHFTQLPDTQYLPWEDVSEYVGCHFSLLKADCFYRVVCSIMWHVGFDGYHVPEARHKDMLYNATMYNELEMVGEAIGDRGIWLALRFALPEGFTPERRLEKGTLVCIAVMGMSSEPPQMWWATVAFSDIDMASRGIFSVEVIEGDPNLLVQKLRMYKAYGLQHLALMFETKLFFYAFKPVLEALDYLRRQPRLPFNDTLLRGSTRAEVKSLPGYVPPCYRDAFFNIVRRMLQKYTFEPGQHKALRWLPHRPVLLVQGPPGTGKSFIGCRLVECIAEFRIKLQSGELRNEYEPPEAGDDDKEDEKPGPILVLTYKNHSLDEFLIDVLDSGVWCGSLRDPSRCACKSGGNPSKFCCKNCCNRQGHNKRLVRVGARSQSPRLMKYNLAQLAKPKYDHKHKLRSLRLEAERLTSIIRRLDQGIVDDSTIRGFMSPYQLDAFTRDNTTTAEDAWREWLKDTDPIFPTHTGYAEMLCTGKEILKLAVDPDSIDAAVLKEKNFSAELRTRLDAEKKTQAVPEQDSASVPLQFANKGESQSDSIDHDIVNSIRAKRAFYHSVCPPPPPPPCRVEIDDHDHTITAEVQQREEAAAFPEGVPVEIRNGRLLPPIFAEVEDLWSLDDAQRRELVGFWMARYRRELYKKFQDAKLEFQGMIVIDNASYDEARLRALKEADIIGLTTTGAAMNQGILRSVKPSVLMVEEAAEILEGQILSCFVDSIKQIILIGDHKQLRPQTDDRDYAERNHYNVSLFQRLIETCKVPYAHLTEQRRMCTKVCDIVRPIYSQLSDFESLKTRTMDWGVDSVPRIPGLANEVMFWEHNHPEQESEIGLSVMNKREVDMVRFLCTAFVGDRGLRQDQLTVLSPYLGQTRVLRKMLQDSGLPDVECLTVDRFQGDENDIVIVSLVRTEKLTSFIRLENRMCVACSRARFGFIMVGNPAMLEQVPHWKRTLEIIRKQSPQAVSDKLCVQRPGSHPPQFITASSADSSFPDPRKDSDWGPTRGDGLETMAMEVDA
eukprot:TRINITY_DN3758_c0_g1_i3.p1 TRINITY_DN3758_c0_g1~~TRINITY_DN3758_c0_g1_i3.p1  ORF type:complete len:1450 (+),score=649.83 TRINITY_DN3758_c0_g1_i3:169-4518(+)